MQLGLGDVGVFAGFWEAPDPWAWMQETPPCPFLALGLSLPGGDPQSPGVVAGLLHWSPNRQPRQTPPDRRLTRFWELLPMERKFPALQVTHRGDNCLHHLFFFLLLPQEAILLSTCHWDTTAFDISLCFV